MKIKYEAKWLPNYGLLHEPRIPVVFRNSVNGNEVPIFCLVDSGAAHILLNTQIGEALGIEIKAGAVLEYSGIGGNVIGYKHKIKMRVAGDKNEYDVECAFAPVGSIDGLLGQEGFFDNYKVVFEKYKNQFEVVAKKR